MSICVIGDGMTDEYRFVTYIPEKKRWRLVNSYSAMGGAANVLHNIEIMTTNSFLDLPICEISKIPLLASTPHLCNMEYSINVDTNEKLLQVETHTGAKLPVHWLSNALDNFYMYNPTVYVLSDYNKGWINSNQLETEVKNVAETVIVDSRYRSLNLDLLSLGYHKVWRCTGEEFNEEWAKNFDIIVHTNADQPIRVLYWRDGALTLLYSKEVPKISPVNTTGAGDVFTGALAVCFHSLPNQESSEAWWDLALDFCIAASQDVCMQKTTGTTNIRFTKFMENRCSLTMQ